MPLGKNELFAIFSSLMLIAAAVFFFASSGKSPEEEILPDQDLHGCIVSAGYGWCNSKQECLKVIDRSCPPKDGNIGESEAITAAKIKAMEMKEFKNENGRNLKVESIFQSACESCWNIYLSYEADSAKNASFDKISLKLTLKYGKVEEFASIRETVIELTEEGCRNLSGIITPKENATACMGNDLNLGEVTGLNESYVCCNNPGLDEIGNFCVQNGGFIKSGVTLNGPADYCFFPETKTYCLAKLFKEGSCRKGEATYKCDGQDTPREGYYDTYTKDLLAWDDCG